MFLNRRDDLYDLMEENSIAIFHSGKAPYKVGDEKYEFSVDRNFYALTGLDKENMILVMIKDGEHEDTMIFIEEYDEMLAKWVGGRMLPQQVREISGIQKVMLIQNFDEELLSSLSRLHFNQTQWDLYADFTLQEASQTREGITLAKHVKELFPFMNICNVAPLMNELRLIKNEDEIEKLKQAIHITDLGIQEMMKHSKQAVSENEIEAYFDFILKKNQCEHSFPSIVAQGKNATILHYVDNNQPIAENSLVLCDLGASYQYLNADITRTFPANGKFTPRQKQIYDIVLRGNKYIIENCKPGETLFGLNRKLIQFYEEELKAIGLLENGKTVRDYYWHGVSHMLGLETHDVTLNQYVLEAGNVITVEPGLYLEEESIGIRIEDDILITEDGCVNLSKDIIKEIDEVEAFMAKF